MRWLKNAQMNLAKLAEVDGTFESLYETATKMLTSVVATTDLPEPDVALISRQCHLLCVELRWKEASLFCFPNYEVYGDIERTIKFNTDAKAVKYLTNFKVNS